VLAERSFMPAEASGVVGCHDVRLGRPSIDPDSRPLNSLGGTTQNKRVAVCAHFGRSGERDTEAAPASLNVIGHWRVHW
jgi:hypothetical protein